MANIERFLDRQNALITGSSSGIGSACATELARRGASVGIVYYSDQQGAEKVAQDCRKFDVEAFIFRANVANPNDVTQLFSHYLQRFNRLDIMIANAGIQADASFINMPWSEWKKVLSTNLDGQFLCSQEAVKIFCSQGLNKEVSNSAGKIIHMSSVHDEIPWAGHVNYAASKGGIRMLMESVALELAEHKIRVNAVSPGAIKTPINRSVWSESDKADKLKRIIPYQRIGETMDIAAPVAWLASDYADYITGTTLYIDGGMTLYPGFLHNG